MLVRNPVVQTQSIFVSQSKVILQSSGLLFKYRVASQTDDFVAFRIDRWISSDGSPWSRSVCRRGCSISIAPKVAPALQLHPSGPLAKGFAWPKSRFCSP